jgi:hypothetical protein
LDILTADIDNAYINADITEKVYFFSGNEFGVNRKDKRVVIIKALYRLKTSGAAWRAHFALTPHSMGYTSSLADPDVWFKPECKPDGFEYYSYVLVYVDDILVISHSPKATMEILAKTFRFLLVMPHQHTIWEQPLNAGASLETSTQLIGDRVLRNI